MGRSDKYLLVFVGYFGNLYGHFRTEDAYKKIRLIFGNELLCKAAGISRLRFVVSKNSFKSVSGCTSFGVNIIYNPL